MDLFEAMLIEAKEDLNVAELLFKNYSYARSIQHSCESGEKAAKSLLIKSGKGIIIHHTVSWAVFELLLEYPDNEDILRIIHNHLRHLENFFGKTRYPSSHRKKLFVPSKIFSKKQADQCLKKARDVLKKVETILTKIE